MSCKCMTPTARVRCPAWTCALCSSFTHPQCAYRYGVRALPPWHAPMRVTTHGPLAPAQPTHPPRESAVDDGHSDGGEEHVEPQLAASSAVGREGGNGPVGGCGAASGEGRCVCVEETGRWMQRVAGQGGDTRLNARRVWQALPQELPSWLLYCRRSEPPNLTGSPRRCQTATACRRCRDPRRRCAAAVADGGQRVGRRMGSRPWRAVGVGDAARGCPSPHTASTHLLHDSHRSGRRVGAGWVLRVTGYVGAWQACGAENRQWQRQRRRASGRRGRAAAAHVGGGRAAAERGRLPRPACASPAPPGL